MCALDSLRKMESVEVKKLGRVIPLLEREWTLGAASSHSSFG